MFLIHKTLVAYISRDVCPFYLIVIHFNSKIKDCKKELILYEYQ